jgi:2,3-bisphosphoglycerate-dependent phosphoglycerate mutase
MAINRVVFIRPGETDWNRLGRWQGHVQVPLNSYGKMQAQRLAKFIHPIGISTMYTSDLRRAYQTAEILCEQLGFAPRADARLRERGVGEWQGLTQEEVMEWYPQEYAQLQANREGFQVSGGESRRQVAERVRQCFQDIMARGGGETIGIVSHTTAIRTLLDDLVPHYNANSHSYSNLSVTTIEHQQGDVWKIGLLDDISHLKGMETLSFPELEDKPK